MWHVVLHYADGAVTPAGFEYPDRGEAVRVGKGLFANNPVFVKMEVVDREGVVHFEDKR